MGKKHLNIKYIEDNKQRNVKNKLNKFFLLEINFFYFLKKYLNRLHLIKENLDY